jgi:HNH endonuclease
MWWTDDESMLHLRGRLPDVMGVTFETAIRRLVELAKPATGQAWDTLEHRAADALVGLCEPAPSLDSGSECASQTLAAKPLFVVSVPQHGRAEVAGIPLPDARVEQLRANAVIEPVLVDDDGVPIAVGKRTIVLSPKIARAVLLRDGHCRIPGCEVRHGLHVHHLRPRSWGGTDDIANLAAVCTIAGHHQMLVPHGPWALVGNPNRPDGLRLVHLTEAEAEAAQLGRPPPTSRTRPVTAAYEPSALGSAVCASSGGPTSAMTCSTRPAWIDSSRPFSRSRRATSGSASCSAHRS